MKVIDNVYLVPGVTANCYILVGADGLTMIDTGVRYSERKQSSGILRAKAGQSETSGKRVWRPTRG